MKKVLMAGLALSIALGIGTTSVKPLKHRVEASSQSYTQEQQEALNYLNDMRREMGLQPVKLNPYLSKAAASHAQYLTINKTTGHTEDKANKGFTGERASIRIKAFGGSALVESGIIYEGIAYQRESIKDGLIAFINTAYHREPLVEPNLSEIGLVIENGIVVANYYRPLKGKNQEEAMYPYNGQKGVETSFRGASEKPNPLEKYSIDYSGYIISYTPASNSHLESLTAKVINSKGQDIPVFVEDGSGIWFMYPKKPLENNETYTVMIDYKGRTNVGSKTWSFSTGEGSFGAGNTDPEKSTLPTDNLINYADFKEEQYWSNNMIWAIEMGLISGYPPIYNAKLQKYETLLKPMDALTEAQFLAVLFRYTHGDELNLTKPMDPDFWASSVYQLASRYNLPTKGSLTSKAEANRAITRGKMAQILASLHFGQQVSESEAIDFMYMAGLSNGYPDQYGNAPMTYETYGAKNTLLRAHIVTFIRNYDYYLRKK